MGLQLERIRKKEEKKLTMREENPLESGVEKVQGRRSQTIGQGKWVIK